jgi:hypothetical protein
MFHKILYVPLVALLALGIGIPAVAQQNAPESALPLIAGPGPYYGPYAQAQALVQNSALTGSKGFSKFTHPTTGVYCLTLGSGVQLKTAPLVSIEWGASLGVVLFAQWNSDNTTCGAATNVIEVRTYKGDTGGVGSTYQIPVLSDRVAFVVLVP